MRLGEQLQHEAERHTQRSLRRIKLLGLAMTMALLVFVLGGVLMSPSYLIERKVIIPATPESIHQWTGDLSRWTHWSPWDRHEIRISDDGQSMSWQASPISEETLADDGEDNAASARRGHLQLIDNHPRTGISWQTKLATGDQLHHTIEYQLGDNQTTTVIWRMRGQMDIPLVGGYTAWLMDPMIGGTLERGLNNLLDVINQPAEFFIDTER